MFKSEGFRNISAMFNAVPEDSNMVTTILRLPDVKARTGLSRSTIYLRVSAGEFPSPVALGGRAVGWPSSEVDTLNAARIAGKTDEEIRTLVQKLECDRKLAL